MGLLRKVIGDRPDDKAPGLSEQPQGNKNRGCQYDCVNDKRHVWGSNPRTDHDDWRR